MNKKINFKLIMNDNDNDFELELNLNEKKNLINKNIENKKKNKEFKRKTEFTKYNKSKKY